MRGVNRTTQDGSGLLQRSLVVLQASLSLVLLVGAGLLGKSLNKLEHQDFGLETKNRVIVSVNPLKAGYKPEQLQALYRQIEDRFHAMPDVERIGLTLYSPLQGNIWSFYVYVQGQPAPDPGKDVTAIFDRASPDYFQAVGQHVVRGRTFTPADTPTSEGVAVINQTFAKTLFKPGENPIGQHFGYREAKSSADFKIVGVVEDTKYENARDAARPMFFLPMLQQSHSNPPKELDASLYAETLVLQMKVVTPGLENRVRQALASVDPNLTVDQYETFAHQIDGNFNAERMITQLTLLFGVLALVLASVGLYGVTSYMVAQRTPEIGIRMALGAPRAEVVRMVLRSALLQVGIGLAIGIPTALLCVRFVKSQLYNVSGEDVWVMAGAVLALALSACIAGLIPARRAASTDPMRALRAE
jgi:macrolide transport system ATP-binding/permease protein